MWKTPWQKLINRSEKIVCYPSSLINIRYLISDEIACVASQVRKLVGTQHPLLKTAKALIGDTRGVSQLRGLIVLLISKTFSEESHNINTNQRSIAEIIETAHAAICIHKDLINIEKSGEGKPINWQSDMQFGNKMATLCGDYFLASVSKALAELQNTIIVDIVSKGIADTIESNFLKININNEDQYRNHIYLSNGSLLSKCCKVAVLLRSDDNIDSDLTLHHENIAEKWAINWCELYNICENIDMIKQQMSSEKTKSKIFQSDRQIENVKNLPENMIMMRNRLDKSKQIIVDIHSQFPNSHKQSKEILAEMSDLLYQDAICNINSFKSF